MDRLRETLHANHYVDTDRHYGAIPEAGGLRADRNRGVVYDFCHFTDRRRLERGLD
jgi:hypothetical protein